MEARPSHVDFLTAPCPVPCPSAGQMRVPDPCCERGGPGIAQGAAEWHTHSLIPLSCSPLPSAHRHLSFTVEEALVCADRLKPQVLQGLHC